MLYNQIQDPQNNGKIAIHPNLCDLLKAEGIKNCINPKYQNKLLTPTLKEAANQLFNNSDNSIRTGDKTNIYSISNKTNYNKKLKISTPTKENFKNSLKTLQTNLKDTLTKLSQLITQKLDPLS